MYRDDFIMRHIRLFVQAIARALGLIKEGDLGFAMETVRVSFADLLGMSLDDFLAYPDDRVKDFLYFGELGPMGLNRAAFAASMLSIAARIQDRTGNGGYARKCIEKALRVLLEATLGEEDPVDMPDFAPAVEEILAEWPIEELGDELVSMLVFHYDRSGDLTGASAAVQALLSRQPADPETRDFARSFYEYLLEGDPARLETGGLAREDVAALLMQVE